MPGVIATSNQECLMQKTQYSAIRKFHVNLRAAEAFKAAAGKNSPTPPEVHSYRMAATAYLKEALQDKTMPVSEACDGCRDLLEATRLNHGTRSEQLLSLLAEGVL